MNVNLRLENQTVWRIEMKRGIVVFFLLTFSGTAFAFPEVDQAKTGLFWILAACDEAEDSDQAKGYCNGFIDGGALML